MCCALIRESLFAKVSCRGHIGLLYTTFFHDLAFHSLSNLTLKCNISVFLVIEMRDDLVGEKIVFSKTGDQGLAIINSLTDCKNAERGLKWLFRMLVSLITMPSI